MSQEFISSRDILSNLPASLTEIPAFKSTENSLNDTKSKKRKIISHDNDVPSDYKKQKRLEEAYSDYLNLIYKENNSLMSFGFLRLVITPIIVSLMWYYNY